MSEATKEAMEYIIEHKQIKTVFQPIISLKDGKTLGHEALSRITCDSDITNTEMLFGVAGECNRLWDLEQLCRYTALQAAYKYMIPPYSKMLFLNVNPNILHDLNFKKGFTIDFLKQFHIAPENIIFEITERNVIDDMNGFLSTIDHYRSQDYKIAIDDAGAGYSGLNLISDIHPNFIKLDMKLIRGIDKDKLKYTLVKGMTELSEACNITLIAEGIETREELETLIAIGIQYGQGYYIQRPSEVIDKVNPELKDLILRLNHLKETRNVINHSYYGLPMLEYDVSISFLMNKKIMIAEYDTPIQSLYQRLTSSEIDQNYDFIILTEQGRVWGIIKTEELIKSIKQNGMMRLNYS